VPIRRRYSQVRREKKKGKEEKVEGGEKEKGAGIDVNPSLLKKETEKSGERKERKNPSLLNILLPACSLIDQGDREGRRGKKKRKKRRGSAVCMGGSDVRRIITVLKKKGREKGREGEVEPQKLSLPSTLYTFLL